MNGATDLNDSKYFNDSDADGGNGDESREEQSPHQQQQQENRPLDLRQARQMLLTRQRNADGANTAAAPAASGVNVRVAVEEEVKALARQRAILSRQQRKQSIASQQPLPTEVSPLPPLLPFGASRGGGGASQSMDESSVVTDSQSNTPDVTPAASVVVHTHPIGHPQQQFRKNNSLASQVRHGCERGREE